MFVKNGISPVTRRVLPLVLMIVVCQGWGCTLKLISDYDDVTDKSVTELQKKVETFLVRMEAAAGTSEGEVGSNKAFYDETKIALSSLRLRAEAIPNNKLTAEQISGLQDNIEVLRKLHESAGHGGLTKILVEAPRTAFNTQFKAILTLELAKKRGKSE